MGLEEVSFSGMADTPVTFHHNGLVRDQDEGKVVKLTGEKEVGLCADADVHWLGRVVQIDAVEPICSVELTGIIPVTYSGVLAASQVMLLLADALGGLRVDDLALTGLPHQVVDVDDVAGVIWVLR